MAFEEASEALVLQKDFGIAGDTGVGPGHSRLLGHMAAVALGEGLVVLSRLVLVG